MNRKLTTGVPELHPIPVKAPWYMVGIDFIGPMSPVAKDGSRYILTISDYFTKWVEVVPTVNKMASTMASSLFKVSMCTNYLFVHACSYLYMHVAVHGFTR